MCFTCILQGTTIASKSSSSAICFSFSLSFFFLFLREPCFLDPLNKGHFSGSFHSRSFLLLTMRRKLLLFLSLYVNLLRAFLQLPIFFFPFTTTQSLPLTPFFFFFSFLILSRRLFFFFFFYCESFFTFTLAIVGLVEITIRRLSSCK